MMPAVRDQMKRDQQRREEKAIQAEKNRQARTWKPGSLLSHLVSDRAEEPDSVSDVRVEMRRLRETGAFGDQHGALKCWRCATVSFGVKLPCACPQCGGLLDYETGPTVGPTPDRTGYPAGICTHRMRSTSDAIDFRSVCWECERS
jgi:hypothetical protein